MVTTAAATERLPPGAVAWSLYEAARIPLVTLVTIFVFAPYFVTQVIGDPVRGQAAVAEAGKWGGWIVALTAPILGATLDRWGPRKLFLAPVTASLALLVGLLWFAYPDGSGLSVPTVIAIWSANTVLYAYCDLGHNSLLARAAPRMEHRASGLALALGNAFSTALLIFVLFAFVLTPHPLFGLDKASHAPDRIVAPIAALSIAIGCLPLFFLTPDAPRTGLTFAAAVRAGLSDLRSLIAEARGQHRNALVFLAARMFYADAKVAIILFGGVYAAGVMGWRTAELLALGVLQGLFSTLGGVLAARFDGRFGPKRAVQIELGMVLIGQIAILGTRPDMILYVPVDLPPLWAGSMFNTLPEIVFLTVGVLNAIGITAAYASSRTLLVRLVPADATGRFFGLYTLSGNATYWLAPFLIELFTRSFGTQQAGFYPVLALLLIGLAILSRVRMPPRPLAFG